jgi:hypothetical protein
MISVGWLLLTLALSPGAAASPSCPGVLVLRLSLLAGGSFSIRLTEITDGTLELRGENGGAPGSGWLIGVYRAEDKESKGNLLPHDRLGAGPTRGDKIGIQAIDWGELRAPLRFAIGATGWDLSVCLVDAKVAGHGGASAGFRGGYVDLRVVVGELKAAGQ